MRACMFYSFSSLAAVASPMLGKAFTFPVLISFLLTSRFFERALKFAQPQSRTHFFSF